MRPHPQARHFQLAAGRPGCTTPLKRARRRIYLANVGANSSHPFASPRFSDGTFELLPIAETPSEPGPHWVRFSDLMRWSDHGASLSHWVPERWLNRAAHADPEFHARTYGDNCDTAPRAAAFRAIRPGDLLFFFANLVDWEHDRRSGLSRFYLVGFLQIDSILRSVLSQPAPEDMARFGGNAHVRRGLNDPRWWSGFWVFGGTARSRRFEHDVPVDRRFARDILRTARGSPWRWDGHRTDLQVIGSYTRSCRCIINPSDAEGWERFRALANAVEQANPEACGVAAMRACWSSRMRLRAHLEVPSLPASATTANEAPCQPPSRHVPESS